jgi:eukaryotic-like serine/threonine-protein kinase
MVGRKLSHYEILRKLGEGGMGIVYLARDTDLDRFVALKFLSPRIVDSGDKIARFSQEARAISALNHPNIATIYGMEELGDSEFLVLEYLPGGSLREKLEELRSRGERLPLPLAIDWTIQIAEGLGHAHRHGIIHRDVKASNVLFAEEGSLKIADFGLAKVASGEHAGLTQEGIAVGTPPCMSPEQARGDVVDERSDIFSLGIILFELITGEPPFRGANTMAQLHEIVYMPARSVSRLRADVPEFLEAAVSKSLEKTVEARYQTMAEFAAALRAPHSQRQSPALRDLSTATMPARFAGSSPHKWKMAVGAVLLAGIPIAAGIPDVRHQASQWFHVRPLPAEKRIAVLEFINIGADPKNRALADGLMEVVSNSLTRMEQGALLVVPATDVRRERVSSAVEAWRRLGANLAITGSVGRNGDAVRIMINLVDTRSITQLRTETVKTDLADPALLDRVVDKVAFMIEPALQPQSTKSVGDGKSHAAGAERYYVEGVGDLRRNDRPESIDDAIGAFKRAIAIDGNYALAWAGLAEAQWRRYCSLRDAESMTAAIESSDRALHLNSRLAPVHITAGMVQTGTGHYDRAAREFQRALDLDPRNAEAYRELATTYSAMGRIDLAEATFKKAIDLRPDAWWTLKQMGMFYFNHGRYPEAELYFTKVIQFTPSSAKAYNNLGGVYLKMGRNNEAMVQLEKSISIEPIAYACGNLGYLYFMDGRFAEAAAQYEKATELIATDFRIWGNLADAYRWTPPLAAKAPAAYQRAIDLVQKEIAINPVEAQLHSRLATYWAALGLVDSGLAERPAERRKAAVEIEKAIRLAPADGTVQFHAAIVYEQAHHRDQALRALTASLQASSEYREEILRVPPLESLRKDPRFHRLFDTHQN